MSRNVFLKKLTVLIILCSILMSGCSNSKSEPEISKDKNEIEANEAIKVEKENKEVEKENKEEEKDIETEEDEKVLEALKLEAAEATATNLADQKVKTIFRKTIKRNDGKDLDIKSIAEATDGGFFIAGHAEGNVLETSRGVNHGNAFEVFIYKYSETGRLQYNMNIGGSFGDFVHKIIGTEDNGFLVCLSTPSTDGDLEGIKDGEGRSDYLVLIKVDKSGNILWKNVVTKNQTTYDNVDIVKNSNNDYIITYSFGSNTTHTENMEVAYINGETGEVKWKDVVDKILYDEQAGKKPGSVRIMNDGNYLVSGSYTSPFKDYGFLRIYDNDGLVEEHSFIALDQNKIGFETNINDAIDTGNGRFFVVGSFDERPVENFTLRGVYDSKNMEFSYEIGKQGTGVYKNIIKLDDSYLVVGEKQYDIKEVEFGYDYNGSVSLTKFNKNDLSLGVELLASSQTEKISENCNDIIPTKHGVIFVSGKYKIPVGIHRVSIK